MAAVKSLRSALCIFLFFPVTLLVAEWTVKMAKGVGPAREDTVSASYMPARLRADYQGTVFDLPFRTNHYGFRSDQDFPLEPEPGEVRILALGDSIGIGLGVRGNEHYTSLLEEDLNALAPDQERFHVVNAAGQGYSPSSYHVYLEHEGLAFRPRLVIMEIELNNDVTDEALLRWEQDSSSPTQLTAVRGGRYVVGWDGNLLGTVALGPFFFEKTYIYTLLLRRFLVTLQKWFPNESGAGRPDSTYFDLGYDHFLLSDRRIERGWERLFGAIAQTRDLLGRQNVPFLLLILPSRYVFEEDAPKRDFARDQLERAARLADRDGIAYLLFTRELENAGGADLFFDFAHPTAQGNRVIADKLAARVSADLGLR